MGTTNPPDSWKVPAEAPLWGVDIDREETLVQFGRYGVVFNDNTPTNNAQIDSDLYPMEGGQSFDIRVLLRQDDITAGNTITVTIQYWQTDRVTAATKASTTVFSGVLAAANTWYEKYAADTATSSNAAFYSIRVVKANNAFNAYLGLAETTRTLPGFRAYRNAAQNATASTWTTIAFDNSVVWGIGGITNKGVTINTGTGIATTYTAGLYDVYARAKVTGLGDGESLEIRLIHSSSTVEFYGSKNYCSGAAQEPAVVLVGTVNAVVGRTYEIQVFQDNASDQAIDPGSTDCFFEMRKRL